MDAKKKALHIFEKVKRCGPQQVRWLHGVYVLTFRYPAPKGYGVRGELIAIYTADTKLEWIEADLVSLLS